MELYPKAVDFDDSWDNLRDCTQRLIIGDVFINKNDWNDRISYPSQSLWLISSRIQRPLEACFRLLHDNDEIWYSSHPRH